MADEIRVIVCVPACSLRRQLIVSPFTTVSALKQYLPNPDCDLLREGSILAESMPLAAYAIADGAMLVAISKDCVQSKDRWAHATLDQDAFEERIGIATNPHLALENARLRDLRMRRVGDRPSASARLRILIAEFEARHRASTEPTRLPDRAPDGPSCSPLPVWWAERGSRRAISI
jgi:hypothetical protein